jgi:hypothetical protein
MAFITSCILSNRLCKLLVTGWYINIAYWLKGISKSLLTDFSDGRFDEVIKSISGEPMI